MDKENTIVYPSFELYLKATYIGPYSGTDAIIRYSNSQKSGIVIIERMNPPFGYAFPGGIAERTSYVANAIKEAHEETNLIFEVDKPICRPFCVMSSRMTKDKPFISSIFYTGQGFGNLKASDDAKSAHIFTLNELADMLSLPFYKKGKVENNCWAFLTHKRAAAIYLKENHSNLTDKQNNQIDNILNDYYIEEDKLISK